MPMNPIAYHQVSVEDLKPYEKKIANAHRRALKAAAEAYGDLEYLIGFNKKGEIYLFARSDNYAEESELKDKPWREVNNALVFEDKDNYIYFRINVRTSETIVEHTIAHKGCYPTGEECPGQYMVVMPVKYRSIIEKINTALANNPPLAPDRLTEVKALRKKGESLHNEQKHAESLNVLAEAEAILRIK